MSEHNNNNPVHDERCEYAKGYDDLCARCMRDEELTHQSEMEAEFRMSWVMGGGSADDASQAWGMYEEDYIAGRIG